MIKVFKIVQVVFFYICDNGDKRFKMQEAFNVFARFKRKIFISAYMIITADLTEFTAD